MHGLSRQDESSVNDQAENEHGSGSQGLLHGTRCLPDCPKDHGHGQGTGEAKKQIDEEGAGFATEIGHEVERHVESYGREDFARQVADHRGDGLGKGMIGSVSSLLFDDWSLSVERKDLGESVVGRDWNRESLTSNALLRALNRMAK